MKNDSQIISAGYDKTIKIWELGTRINLKTFSGYHNWIFDISLFANQTKLLLVTSDNMIQI